jgi:hypothetical protein
MPFSNFQTSPPFPFKPAICSLTLMLTCAVRAPIPSISELLCQVHDLPICLIAFPPCQGPEPRSDLQEVGPTTHGPWSGEEDMMLSFAVQRYGTSQWDAVSGVIPGRGPTQCRERWMFRIGPGLNKAPFQTWEDDLILRARRKLGNHWALIATKLPGRTSCAVKNRWYSVLRNRSARRADAQEEWRH